MQGSSKKKLAHTLDASTGKLNQHQQQSLSLHPFQYQQQQQQHLSQQLSHQQIQDLLPSKSAVLSQSSQDPIHFSSINTQQNINSPCTRPSFKPSNVSMNKGQQQLFLQLNQTALSLIKNGSNFKIKSPMTQLQTLQTQQQQASLSQQAVQSSTEQALPQNLSLKCVMNGQQQTSQKQLNQQVQSSIQSKDQLLQSQGINQQQFVKSQKLEQIIDEIPKFDMKSNTSVPFLKNQSAVSLTQIPQKKIDKISGSNVFSNNTLLKDQIRSFTQKNLSITPNNGSENRVKLFESLNKTQSKTRQSADENIHFEISKELSDKGKCKQEPEENSKINEDNKLFIEKGQLYSVEPQKYENHSIQVAAQQNVFLDKAKNRDNQGNNHHHSKNTRNAHSQGFACNASYSKSSLPSSNSTTVQNHQSHHTSGAKISGDVNSALVLGPQLTQPGQQKNSSLNANKSPIFSKTLSTALSSYQSLLGQEGFTSSSAAKLTHSQHTTETIGVGNIPNISHQMQQILQSNGIFTGGNNGIQGQKAKHRKVASMSSSSPKYGQENILVDCLKAMHCKQPTVMANIPNPKQDLDNQRNQQSQLGKERELSFPVNGQIDNNIVQSSPYAFKTPYNHSLDSSAHNHVNECSQPAEISKNEVQKKSKNVLSKITNHPVTQKKQENIIKKPDIPENSQLKQYQQQKKQLKSQSMTAPGINYQQEYEKQYIPISENIYQLIVSQNNQNSVQMKKSNDLKDQKPSKDAIRVAIQQRKDVGNIHNENDMKNIEDMQSANELMSDHFAGLLKQRIDENSYSQIMEVFSELISNDIYFQPSLCKFKICLDALMHDINSKMKNLRSSAAKIHQLKRTSESASQEKKQLLSKVAALQAENALLLSNSTNVTNSNQSKNNHCLPPSQDDTNFHNIPENDEEKTPTNNGISKQKGNQHIPQHARNRSFDGPHIASLGQAEKCTQTGQETNQDSAKVQQIPRISLEEVDQAVSENAILREYVEEQENKLAAYKDKESRMISLLLAIKNRGVDIDEIYEKDVIAQGQQKQTKQSSHKNDGDNDDDDDEDDDMDNQEKQQQPIEKQSKFIDKLQNVIKTNHGNQSSFGDADESIVNDSDESSFNYYGKIQSQGDDSINSSASSPLRKEQYNSNMNSGRSKFEDGMKLKLRLNLSDLKKVNTQANDEIVVPNNLQEQQLKNTEIQQLNISNEPSSFHNDIMLIENNPFQDFNLADKHKPTKQISAFVQNQIHNKDLLDIHNNPQNLQQPYQETTPMQEYLFHPQTKMSQKELAKYIQQSDIETHQIDHHFQDHFDFQDEPENNILLDCNDFQGSQVQTRYLQQRLEVEDNSTGGQNELIDALGDISQTWPNENKHNIF